MSIAEVIRDAEDDHEIYFLLTAYVEAVRYCDKLNTLPASMRDLPLAGVDDVKTRVESLQTGLGAANERDCLVIREAMEIFAAARERLGSLEEVQLRQLPIAA